MTDATEQQAVTVAQEGGQDRKFAFRDGQFVNRVSGEPIPLDEPVIIFRARDNHSLPVLREYLTMASDPHHRQAIKDRMGEFAEWRAEHPDRVKEPGITHHIRLNDEPASLPCKSGEGAGESARDKAIAAIRVYLSSAGVPATEFDPEFAVRMMGAMMVSFHKYGRVADAYPLKFDAASDVRARMAKYRETGNKHYLVDAANFAMIEAMHSGRKGGSQWGTNDAADSPGRTTASGHRLVQEANDGSRIMGETILHIPGEPS